MKGTVRPGWRPGQGEVIIETERLRIRPWRENEFTLLEQIYAHPEVQRFLPGIGRAVSESAQVELRRLIQRSSGYGSNRGVWAISSKLTGQPVGTVLLKPIPRADSAPPDEVEVGWHLGHEHWGHGYATEAGRAVIEFGLSTGCTEIVAVIDPTNEGSVRVAERCGMTLSGQTTQYYKGETVLRYTVSV